MKDMNQFVETYPNSKTLYFDLSHATKKAPVKGRGQPECFHNGIILIANCFKFVSLCYKKQHNLCNKLYTRICNGGVMGKCFIGQNFRLIRSIRGQKKTPPNQASKANG